MANNDIIFNMPRNELVNIMKDNIFNKRRITQLDIDNHFFNQREYFQNIFNYNENTLILKLMILLSFVYWSFVVSTLMFIYFENSTKFEIIVFFNEMKYAFIIAILIYYLFIRLLKFVLSKFQVQ